VIDGGMRVNIKKHTIDFKDETLKLTSDACMHQWGLNLHKTKIHNKDVEFKN
jgi:hypothetical protein